MEPVQGGRIIKKPVRGGSMKNSLQESCVMKPQESCISGLTPLACILCNPTRMSQPEEQDHGNQGVQDRISELPHDIILNHIISVLDMKEAARTSILSKRFRSLWAHCTNLNFDYNDIVPKDKYSHYIRFIKCVDGVLGLHCGPSIIKFTIRVKLVDCRGLTKYVDRWVKFAFSKGVKVLEVTLALHRGHPNRYSLGFDIFNHSSNLGSASIFENIRLLTSLELRCVEISGKFMEFLLSKCSLLERLCVAETDGPVNLKVRSSKLKHLSLRRCYNLEEVEIHAVNLIYFEFYDGRLNFDTRIVFKSAPLLVEAAIGGRCCFFPFQIFRQFNCLSSQLSTLSLDLAYAFDDRHRTYDIPTGVIPTFSNVKHLVVVLDDQASGLFRLMHFIKACPNLETLKLQFNWCYYNISYESPWLMQEECLKIDQDHKGHKTLKTLEIKGFMGKDEDVDLVLHLLNNTLALETIICGPAKLDFMNGPLIETSRCRAEKLGRIIPCSVKLVVV